MCGIVGYVGKRSAQDVLLDGLEKLEYRGYDSAGVALALDGGIRVVKSKGRLTQLRQKLAAQALAQSFCGIGHTRWATHGEPSDVNSHPHSTPRVSIVHNGIIENYGILKERLMAKGDTFESETDTEVLVKLIDSCYTGDPLRALQEALAKVRGSYALAVLFRDRPDTIFAVKRESPLIVGWGEGENFVASDIPALLKYTRRYSVLEEGDMAVCTAEGIRFYNEFAEPVQRPVLTADWDMEAAEKGGYPHFMLKEIMEQPKAVTDTVTPRIKNNAVCFEDNGLTDERLRDIENIHIIGCGSALHAGMVGKRVIEAMCRIRCSAEVASEFRYENPIIGKKDMCIVISQSGETADTLAAMRLAKQAGAFTIAIVNVVSSTIAREADGVLYTWAGPEISVATTKAYSTQLAACYLLATEFARVRGTLADGQYENLVVELEALPEKIEKTLADKERIQWFASKYANAKDAFFIGRGLDYAVALEGSLKFKEISYIHSEAFAAGEMKHGPISLVEKGTLVVGILTQPDLFEKSISNMVEVKSRGAFLMGLTTYGNYNIEDTAGFTVYVPKTDPHFTTSLSVIPLQLLAYYVSCAKGLDVDKPRNLAKSVTVE